MCPGRAFASARSGRLLAHHCSILPALASLKHAKLASVLHENFAAFDPSSLVRIECRCSPGVSGNGAAPPDFTPQYADALVVRSIWQRRWCGARKPLGKPSVFLDSHGNDSKIAKLNKCDRPQRTAHWAELRTAECGASAEGWRERFALRRFPNLPVHGVFVSPFPSIWPGLSQSVSATPTAPVAAHMPRGRAQQKSAGARPCAGGALFEGRADGNNRRRGNGEPTAAPARCQSEGWHCEPHA